MWEEVWTELDDGRWEREWSASVWRRGASPRGRSRRHTRSRSRRPSSSSSAARRNNRANKGEAVAPQVEEQEEGAENRNSVSGGKSCNWTWGDWSEWDPGWSWRWKDGFSGWKSIGALTGTTRFQRRSASARARREERGRVRRAQHEVAAVHPQQADELEAAAAENAVSPIKEEPEVVTAAAVKQPPPPPPPPPRTRRPPAEVEVKVTVKVASGGYTFAAATSC